MYNRLSRFLTFMIIISIMFSLFFACKEKNTGEIEVLHWWTSGGEAKAMAQLQRTLEDKGHTWKDFAVAGGAGNTAMTVLKTRVLSGTPPVAAQIKGPSIQDWGKLNVLSNLNPIAKKNNWEKRIPPAINSIMKHKGNYVAVPVNIHRNNWIWINRQVFEKAKVKPPKTWDEFERVAEKLKKAGFIPVAHGGQNWQDNTVFEIIALATGKEAFYRKAFMELDENTLKGPVMIKTFERLRTYKKYIDKDSPGRDWNLATSMVIQGKAGMQFMGDWAKGEFFAAGKKAEQDFIAAPAPGTNEFFIFTTDSFMCFKQGDKELPKTQVDFVEVLLGNSFQKVFNMNKGSIPVTLDTPLTDFDIYGKKSSQDFKKNIVLPSMAHGMAVNSAVKGAIEDVVTNFFNSDNMSAKEAAQRLAKSILGAKKKAK